MKFPMSKKNEMYMDIQNNNCPKILLLKEFETKCSFNYNTNEKRKTSKNSPYTHFCLFWEQECINKSNIQSLL